MIRDIKYWAGLADADGSFNLALSKRPCGNYYGQVSFTLYQKNRAILEDFANMFGVNVNRSDVHYVTLTGTKARSFMQQVKNHLVVKNVLVENLLKIDKTWYDKDTKKDLNKSLKAWRYSNSSNKVQSSRKWASGYIDGDGSLSASYNKRSGLVEFKVSVVSHKDQDVGLQLLKKSYGGFVTNDSNCNRWSLTITKNSLNRFREFSKHLKIKARQYDFIVDVISKGSNMRKNGATPESNFLLKEYLKYLNSLNSQYETPATTKSLDDFKRSML